MSIRAIGNVVDGWEIQRLFGVEPRLLDRSTGNPSFCCAQPQDLIGIMVTQPVGQTGVKLKAFVVNEFKGHADFNEPPSAGFTLNIVRLMNEFCRHQLGWAGLCAKRG